VIFYFLRRFLPRLLSSRRRATNAESLKFIFTFGEKRFSLIFPLSFLLPIDSFFSRFEMND